MNSKTARILGILISVLVLFASCGQIAGSGESRVSVNLPYVNNANSRAISSEDIQRIKGDHAGYRVHMNDTVLEGTGGNFSATLPIGSRVYVFIECVNGNGEVILRTVTKSIVVTSGENTINFNLKADGNEITPSAPSGDNPPSPQPVTGRVTYAGNGDYVSGTPTDNTSYNENADVQLSATEPTRPGYKFNGWTATVELICQNASSGSGTIPVGTPFVSASSSITSPTKITSFTMPASGVVLTAQWTLKNYTVTFNTDGGSSVNSITDFNINYGGAFPNATKTGYSFQTWQIGSTPYTSSTLKDAIAAGTVGSTSESIALTAKWDEVSTLYVSETGNDSKDGTSASNAFGQLKKACDVVNAGSLSSYTIIVSGTITETQACILSTNKTVTIKTDTQAATILRGSGATGDSGETGTGFKIQITNGTVNFEASNTAPLIIDGNKNTFTGHDYLLLRIAGGNNTVNVTIGSNVIFQNNSKTKKDKHGAAIGINGANVTLILNGGTIKDNDAYKLGAGVDVRNGATFVMESGTISGNNNVNGNVNANGSNNGDGSGAGVYVGGTYNGDLAPTFTMNGGTITGNTAPQGRGAGIFVEDGGICTVSPSATVISNTAEGDGANSSGNQIFAEAGATYNGNVLSSVTKVE